MQGAATTGKVQTAVSVSLDGFMARDGEGAAAAGLHDWLTDGDTQSRVNPTFHMAPQSAEFFDQGVAQIGAVLAGRRTYEISEAWLGRGPIPTLPLFVLTHEVPPDPPASDPPYTFVTSGFEDAVAQAQAAAAGRDIHLMGASLVQQAITAGLLDELILSVVPLFLGEGTRLLDGLPPERLKLSRVIDAPGVTHLTYALEGRD